MKKKLLFLTAIYIIAVLVVLPLCWWVSLSMTICLIIGGCVLFSFLILNKLYKKTNHWKNNFLFTQNFISNSGYRDNISRNFDIANLGSNPALFGFFYENVRGQNWATGSQGLQMDFEILKYNHSYLKEGGYVLIPIMPFTSISQYIKTKPSYWSPMYYLKFTYVVDGAQVQNFPYGKMLQRLKKYPLFFYPKAVRFIPRDVKVDKRLSVAEQNMDALKLEQDARKWIYGWEQEFDVKTKEGFFDKKFQPYENEAVSILKNMIDFCIERNLKPVLITVPMSRFLSKEFSEEFRQKLLYDFVKKVNDKNIPFLDYMFSSEFSDSELYYDSFFLNLRGRKLFTRKVLKDLKLTDSSN